MAVVGVPHYPGAGGLAFLPATELARAIRAGEVSSRAAVAACLDRIAAINPQLNAVVQLSADALPAAAAADRLLASGAPVGPLHGVPVTVKDTFETAGLVSSAGLRERSDFVPCTDATVVARLRRAGAILLGKTNVAARGGGLSGNEVYGATSNPYDLSCSSGGSSAGEAAAVAAGCSPLGIGSDSGGSLRLPAHFCGVAALRPTTGRVPSTGHFPRIGGSDDPLSQVGPVARTVRDLSLALGVIAGPDWQDPSVIPMPPPDPTMVCPEDLRVACYEANGIVAPTPETAAVVRRAADALADAGLVVERARPPSMGRSWELFITFWAHTAPDGADLPHDREAKVSYGRDARSFQKYLRFLADWEAYRVSMLRFMRDFNVVICPVEAGPAVPHGRFFINSGGSPMSTYTATYSLLGWPSATVRAGESPEGLPIGVQISGRPWREDAVLAVASRVEQALTGWRPPSL
jgi:amidase